MAAAKPRAVLPFERDELDRLFAPLLQYSTIILAVSGGADSLALMHLVSQWRSAAEHAGNIIVATVDHGLRPESRAEAEWVGAQAAGLGFEHAILVWGGAKPSTGIQEAARAARYRLLTELADAHRPRDGRAAVVTAHTQEDQAETILMRLARGSGIDGLSGMPPVRPAASGATSCDLLRPLLAVSGVRLREALRTANMQWLEDPSNAIERFERVRIRKAASHLADIGIGAANLSTSARRLARARAALDAGVEDLQRDVHLDLHRGAFASFAVAPWREAPEELRLRLVGRLISAFGGASEPISLASLEALAERMWGTGFEGATLGGAIIEGRTAVFRIMREGQRHPLPVLRLQPGSTVLWDGRFRVNVSAMAPAPVTVGALGAGAYADLRHLIDVPGNWAARAAATLPAIRAGDELLVVPQLADFHGAPPGWREAAGLYSAEFAF